MTWTNSRRPPQCLAHTPNPRSLEPTYMSPSVREHEVSESWPSLMIRGQTPTQERAAMVIDGDDGAKERP